MNTNSVAGADLPLPLQRRSSDEYEPEPHTPESSRAASRVGMEGPESSDRVAVSLTEYWRGRRGTAAALLALNDEYGRRYYEVPAEAALDEEAAAAAFDTGEIVIDVQTHFLASRPNLRPLYHTLQGTYLDRYRPAAYPGPEAMLDLGFVEWMTRLYLESETAVAVLTSPPGTYDTRALRDEDMVATRLLLDEMGSRGRLLHHVVVDPTVPGEIEALAVRAADMHPAGWKVYTMGTVEVTGAQTTTWRDGSGWMLDDEQFGIPFLQAVEASGVKRVCAHKGLSALAPTGAPSDVGPVATMFPNIDFLIYHSAYEARDPNHVPEGEYLDRAEQRGTDRLVQTLLDHGVAPGSNVYAELGTTWFCLMKRPEEAAHVLGKLLRAVGPDNVLWGTDSIWYGSPQPVIDAFRAFQIPDDMCERYGYPKISRETKAKILGLNGAAVYGLDLDAVRHAVATDPIDWARRAIAENRRTGRPA